MLPEICRTANEIQLLVQEGLVFFCFYRATTDSIIPVLWGRSTATDSHVRIYAGTLPM